MRLIVARCSVEYSGRLSASLPEATRLIMIKADGSLSVHADGGAYKPLNWMNSPNSVRESDGELVVTNSKGETLRIVLHEVAHDVRHDLGDDPGLVKDGVEAHLQELLAAAPWTIEAGLTLVRREYPTAVGPVDLLCRDESGSTVAIEVKRRGEIDGVEQLSRYLDCLAADSSLGTLRGILVAQVVRPQARVLAERRGLTWREVNYDEMRGLRTDDLRLF
jgi:RecB family endonuclease NucS